MLRYSRLTFISVLLLLALIVPANVVQAQATPQAPVDLSVAPDANLAVPDEVAQVVKLRESLTSDQLSKIRAVIASHKAEFQEVSDALAALGDASSAQDNKSFLPLVNASGGAQSQAGAAKLASAPKAISAEKAGQLRQIALRLLAVQAKVDQEVKGLLTASQSEVYAKQAAKLKSVGEAVASKLQAATTQSPEGAETTSDCWNGAYYGAVARYYAYYGYVYAYYNYVYYSGNSGNYAYYAYLYAYYQWYYLSEGLHLAGGAYFDAAYGFGYDYAGWSDTATTYFYNAYYYSYYAYQYAYQDYQIYGNYYPAYYAYYYEYNSDYYAYYAYYYESLC